MPSSIVIRHARILTMNDAMEVVEGAVSVRDGRIVEVGPAADLPGATVIDAAGGYLLPGFVQTHLHLCQTLFRGYADDLRLLDWLRTRIWPMEAAHTPASLRAASELACLELLRGGTTAVLTMETVHDTEAVFEAVSGTGMRATIGKCMMDAPDAAVPARLREDTRAAIDRSLALHRTWHRTSGGRIRAAFAPRFALSCTTTLLESVAALSADEAALVHTHASEQREEVDLVRRMSGVSNIEYLDKVGLVSSRLCAAHCVWVDPAELDLLARRDAKVLHCPGSNLKLGSGIAAVTDMMARGICVSLGADGAACNNQLDMFGEMRLAATLQAMRHGPGTLDARQALWMATRNGARTLGLEDQIGSVEAGKQADLILIAADGTNLATAPDPFSAIVYSGRPDNVAMTMVAGEILMRNGQALNLDGDRIAATARTEALALAGRAGL